MPYSKRGIMKTKKRRKLKKRRSSLKSKQFVLWTKVVEWGVQTTTAALNVRAMERGEPADDPAALQAMEEEAEIVTEELWQKALAECDEGDKPSKMLRCFERNILDWCINQRTV